MNEISWNLGKLMDTGLYLVTVQFELPAGGMSRQLDLYSYNGRSEKWDGDLTVVAWAEVTPYKTR